MEDDILSQTAHAVSTDTAQLAPRHGHAPDLSARTLDRILTSLSDDKAEDVVAIDLAGRSAMADHIVVASGRSSRQVAAIADKLTERLKRDLGVACKVEGKDQGDWVLIDTGDVIVHVFRPEVRDFYQLEKMWRAPEPRAV